MNILITGSHGQLGQILTHKLLPYHHVISLSHKQLDITDKTLVIDVINRIKPEIIINAAAYTAVELAETEVELSYQVNRDGPKYLAQAAENISASLLHISTDYVFDGNKVGCYTEADLTNPQSIYGKSKLEGEKAVLEACSRAIILRTAWSFCEYGNNFVKTMLRLGADRESLGIVADQFGGPTYAGDIASALITIAEKIHSAESLQNKVNWGIYHFSGVPAVSWFEFAKTIFDNAVEHNVLPKIPTLNPLTTADYPTSAKRPTNSVLDCSKIFDKFDIKPSDWKAALENISAYK